MDKKKLILIFALLISLLLSVLVSGQKNVDIEINQTSDLSLEINAVGGIKGSSTPVAFKTINPEQKILEERRISGAKGFVQQSVDSNIDLALDDNEWVEVGIVLKDTSNLTYLGKLESTSKGNVKTQKIESNGRVSNDLLRSFTNNDFKLKKVSASKKWITGEVSKSGLSKLRSNDNVWSVHLPKNTTVSLDDSIEIVRADDVWNLGFTGTGETVCVIDTGVDTDHPDLLGRVKAEKCFCTVTDEGSGGCCPDGTGEDDSAEDGHGHGTKVAGVIVSTDPTFRGVAPDAKIVAVKATNDNGNGDTSDLVNAIEWCRTNKNTYGISVISISLQTSEFLYSSASTCDEDLVGAEVTDAYDDDILVVAASGNDGSTEGIGLPACASSAVAVGASTKSDSIWSFTNRNSLLDFLAPGVSIQSLDVGGGISSAVSGTSYAAPHVAGAALLMLDKDGSLNPSEIKQALVDTGISVDGYPRIDALSALESLDETADPSGDLSNCAEPGYEYCYEFTFGTCDVKLGANYFGNVNNVSFGNIVGGTEPYVIGDYLVGWNGLDTEKNYYAVNNPGSDCDDEGCSSGSLIGDAGTQSVVSATGTSSADTLVGWEDTSQHWCYVYFNSFTPTYGSDPIYVLNCYDDGDCSNSQYCDRTGTWQDWSCISRKADGLSCTSNSKCSSGFCDVDGEGLSDDGWCFTPHNGAFDGEENTFCEISTGNGTIECDERLPGTDLDSCVSVPYFETECSSSCDYQNISNTFECNKNACSCGESLCHGLSSGANVTTCSGGQSYFADKCSSTAGGEDRDSICRSSSFALTCTGDSECDGMPSGVGQCSSSCEYLPPAFNISIDAFFETNSVGDFRYLIVELNNTGTLALNNTRWEWLTEDGETISSQNNFTLASGAVHFIGLERNFSGEGAFNTTFTVINDEASDSKKEDVLIGGLLVREIKRIGGSGNLVNIQALIFNNMKVNISGVNVSADFGDGNSQLGTELFDLPSNETMAVNFSNNYSSSGSYNVTITATNQSMTNSMVNSIATMNSPVMTALPNVTFLEDGFNDSIDLDDFVSDVDDLDSALAWKTVGGNQISVSIHSGSHVTNFTASQDWSGEENITFVVNDTGGNSDSFMIEVSVSAVNDAPTFSGAFPSGPGENPGWITWPEDEISNLHLLSNYFSDVDLDTLRWNHSSVQNLTITIDSGNGQLNITPDQNWNGQENVTFTVFDAANLTASSHVVTLNVTPVDDSPILGSNIPNVSWQEDTQHTSLNLSQYFHDVDGDNLAFSVTHASNISIGINQSMVTFSPDTNFVGVRTVTFHAIDSSFNVSSNQVTLDVTAVNDAPRIDSFTPSSTSLSLHENRARIFNHSSSDVDGDSLSYSWELDGVEKATSQGYSYEPTTGDAGIHNLTLHVSDASLTTTQEWMVNVTNTSEINVSEITVIEENPQTRFFIYSIKNIGEDLIAEINTSINTGERIRNVQELISLPPGETRFFAVEEVYQSSGDKVITASASAGTSQDVKNKTINVEIKRGIVSRLSLESEGSSKQFIIGLENNHSETIYNTSWSISIGEETITSNESFSLPSGDTWFVGINKSLSENRNYYVTASIQEGAFQDSRAIMVGDVRIIDIQYSNTSLTNISVNATIFNNKTAEVTGINYTWLFGDGTNQTASQLLNISANSSVTLTALHEYTIDGSYNANISIFNNGYNHSKKTPVSKAGIPTGGGS